MLNDADNGAACKRPSLLASPPHLHVHVDDGGCSSGQCACTRHRVVDSRWRRLPAGARPGRGDGQGGEVAGGFGQRGPPVLAHQLRRSSTRGPGNFFGHYTTRWKACHSPQCPGHPSPLPKAFHHHELLHRQRTAHSPQLEHTPRNSALSWGSTKSGPPFRLPAQTARVAEQPKKWPAAGPAAASGP